MNTNGSWRSGGGSGVPEVPGGYVIGRYLDNAFRQVVYNNKPARDVLVDYNRLINEEIERKRIEFGLPTTVGGAAARAPQAVLGGAVRG